AVLDGEPRVCDIDEGLIGRTISNLMMNAMEHAPDGTKITVCIRHDAGRRETAVSVSDQGPGIPDEFKEKIFDKFFQVGEERRMRKATTGLGLSFCQLVVRAHGGDIRVENAEGGGARFVFTLPEVLPGL
ncbi:MAG TPA: ATP-binding protein, partial [Dissulfurispiraceae bacterium]